MSGFKYTGYVPGRVLIVEVEKVLRAAGIPNVLWDSNLLSTYGAPVLTHVSSWHILTGCVARQLTATGY